MSNVATVSFTLPPDHYTVLKAMANSEKKTVSEFVRDTLTEVLDLPAQSDALASFFSGHVRKAEQNRSTP